MPMPGPQRCDHRKQEDPLLRGSLLWLSRMLVLEINFLSYLNSFEKEIIHYYKQKSCVSCHKQGQPEKYRCNREKQNMFQSTGNHSTTLLKSPHFRKC